MLRADSGYPGALVSWAGRVLGLGCDVEIVQRERGQRRFVVVEGRWIVERTFGWLGLSRRLSKDDEGVPEPERAMVLWSVMQLMLRRLHPGQYEHTRYEYVTAASEAMIELGMSRIVPQWVRGP